MRKKEQNIKDVRKALWDAYKLYFESVEDSYCKPQEAYCDVFYPNYFECEDDFDKFCEPNGIMIYSYCLGPSRSHYIFKGKEDKQIDYDRWESPNIYKKAVEIINRWAESI